MQFFYHKNAGDGRISLEAADLHYLFRVRRFDKSEILKVRNLIDKKLYFYKYDKKDSFILDNFIESSKLDSANLDSKSQINIILAMIDLKDIYDILPFLNALDVASVSFFYAQFSQKNRILNMEKIKKILAFSCMQCNRIDFMKINIFKDLSEVFSAFENACFMDFASEIDSKNMESKNSVQTLESLSDTELKNIAKCGIIIGPEGGFSQSERANILSEKPHLRLQTQNILTAQLCAIYIASLCSRVCG